jgi:hypothetical protein
MATVSVSPRRNKKDLPPLENGDRMDQKTFHARYQAGPESVRAELIGGIVYMSSPMRRRHGRFGTRLIHWLGEYEVATPGTEVLDNTTNILGMFSEPQPDGCLLILPECGGQTHEDKKGIFAGPPNSLPKSAARPSPSTCMTRNSITKGACANIWWSRCKRTRSFGSPAGAANSSKWLRVPTVSCVQKCFPVCGSTQPRYCAVMPGESSLCCAGGLLPRNMPPLWPNWPRIRTN